MRKPYAGSEFGFTLQAAPHGRQFVGEVDRDSPAERAGLQPFDRIVGVNGHLVPEDERHKEVGERSIEDARRPADTFRL